jgi:predicted nucleic acid-binding protein
MAIGQLIDYRRFMKKPRCAILLPLKQDHDILQLAKAENIGVIWSTDNDFRATFDLW